MAKIETPMTPDELRNNYEFKVVRRGLIKEYPWIKDVDFNEEDLNKYNLIFLDIVVDPVEMAEAYGYELTPWVITSLKNNYRYTGNYPSLLFNISYEDGKDEIIDPINRMINGIHISPALPDDLRLPSGRQMQVSHFIAVSYTHLTLPTICSV